MPRIAAFALTVLAGAAAGLLAGRSTDRFWLAMVVTGAALGAVALAGWWFARRDRRLLAPIGAALALVTVAMGVLIGLPTLVGKTVDEAVATGRAIHAGQFVSIAHDGEGRAAVVELPTGARRLTLTSFATASGPDLRVYLATGDPATGDLGDHVDLGALKGNRGNQQYEVPAGTDLARYGTVVIWCRAFSVPFTSARLA